MIAPYLQLRDMGLKCPAVSSVASAYVENITSLMACSLTCGGNAKFKHVPKCVSGLWPEPSPMYVYNDQTLKDCSVRASFYNLRKEKQNRNEISQYFKTC